MKRIKNSKKLIAEAAKYGVKLQDEIVFNPALPLLEVKSQFDGEEYEPSTSDPSIFESVFGIEIKGRASINVPKPNIMTRTNVQPVSNPAPKAQISAVSKQPVIAAFTIPKTAPVQRAISSGATLLTNQKAPVQQIINNTKAVAALGDADAQRGLLVLNAADKILSARGGFNPTLTVRTAAKVDNRDIKPNVFTASFQPKADGFTLKPLPKPVIDKVLKPPVTVVQPLLTPSSLYEPPTYTDNSGGSSGGGGSGSYTDPGSNYAPDDYYAEPLPVENVKKEYTKSEIYQLAQTQNALPKVSWFKRFKHWLGFKVPELDVVPTSTITETKTTTYSE